MADASRDNNYVTTLMGVSLSDLETPEKVAVDPANNRLMVSALLTNGLPVPNVDYDYLDVQQTSTTVETAIYKNGGSGGTTVLTVVITYVDDTKEEINTVSWS